MHADTNTHLDEGSRVLKSSRDRPKQDAYLQWQPFRVFGEKVFLGCLPKTALELVLWVLSLGSTFLLWEAAFPEPDLPALSLKLKINTININTPKLFLSCRG